MYTNKIKNVLYVGRYNNDYCRNYTFINSLKKNDINVFEINFNKLSKKDKILYLLKKLRKFNNQQIDLMLYYSLETFSVPFFIVRIYAFIKRIPFVHDIFISKLQTYYFDRDLNIIKKRIKVRFYYWFYYYLLDFFESHFSNYVFLDTLSHIKFFHDKFRIPLNKFYKLYIGARDDIFYPLDQDTKKKNEFIVGFWGTFIPLQGIEYILKAAKILENESDIKFVIIGDGQTFLKNKMLAEELKIKNLMFTGFIPLKELPAIIKNFDIVLGIFGPTSKTLQVIPNKIFEGNSMKLPIISCESPAINELYKDSEDIILCKPADPKTLAESIFNLKTDTKLREKIKENGYLTYQKKASSRVLSERILKILNFIVNN